MKYDGYNTFNSNGSDSNTWGKPFDFSSSFQEESAGDGTSESGYGIESDDATGQSSPAQKRAAERRRKRQAARAARPRDNSNFEGQNGN